MDQWHFCNKSLFQLMGFGPTGPTGPAATRLVATASKSGTAAATIRNRNTAEEIVPEKIQTPWVVLCLSARVSNQQHRKR